MDLSKRKPHETWTSERRRERRYDVVEYALVRYDGIEVRALIQDVGLGGLRFASRHEFFPSQQVQIIVGRGFGEPRTIPGEIRYCLGHPESDIHVCGVKFTAESQAERREVAEFINAVFRRQFLEDESR